MPFIEVFIAGRQPTAEQKKRLMLGVRETMRDVLGSADEQVRIIVTESEGPNYYYRRRRHDDVDRIAGK